MADIVENENSRTLLDKMLEKEIHECERRLPEVMKVWKSMYGSDRNKMAEELAKVEKELEKFWEYKIDAENERKSNLITRIDQSGAEATTLEKALGLPNKVGKLQNEIPLVELEEQLWDLLQSYRELREERVEECVSLIKQEEQLSAFMEEKSMHSTVIQAFSDIKNVPSKDLISDLKKRIKHLDALKKELELDFHKYKSELKILLEECGITPFNRIERFASGEIDESSIPLCKKSLIEIQEATERVRGVKKLMKDEADQLREEIFNLSRKMLKDSVSIHNFLAIHGDFSKETTEKLKAHLRSLKEERMGKIKDLILCQRNRLDELWTKCHFSDKQRGDFRPYNVDYYTEDILELHELEVERLETFYDKHKEIFQLAEEDQELWAKLSDLEEAAAHKDRLFNNRGGRLLQEEKTRKLLQKKIPQVRKHLVSLLNEYKSKQKEDFLYMGVPLIETLSQMEEEREFMKENKKMTRKVANAETILLEAKLGSQPAVNLKRKMLTPHRPATATKVMKMTPSLTSSTSMSSLASENRNKDAKVGRMGTNQPVHSHTPQQLTVRTPAASTPENGSPSYESFQDCLEKSAGRNCPKSSSYRVLRQQNAINTNVTNVASRMKPPLSTKKNNVLKTPVKTPSRIPFRSASASKIPISTPPVKTRSATKLTTPRSRLPIIF